VLERARDARRDAMLNIATRESEWDDVLATAEREVDVWASSASIRMRRTSIPISIRPSWSSARGIRASSASARPGSTIITTIVTANGSAISFRDAHRRVRARPSCRSIVHTRDAEADTAAILRDEMGKGAFPGVIHCFTASGAFADIALDLGFYISISGIVTFKNAKDLQETAARLPLDRLLIETDAPFLAPVPHRGKTGEPAFVADTCQLPRQFARRTIEHARPTRRRAISPAVR
jgi:TatD DNase family protein